VGDSGPWFVEAPPARFSFPASKRVAPDGAFLAAAVQLCVRLPLESAFRPSGLRIGLQMEAGWGLPADAHPRAAVEAAARAFEAAGAIVEPMGPFSTREMADGLDRFWRMRSYLDMSALPAERQAKVLPAQVAAGAAPASARPPIFSTGDFCCEVNRRFFL
jgi:Asp-tRNA(Asn)/Glu-tRNA(Gln) amidotransferase A subunit family amidase